MVLLLRDSEIQLEFSKKSASNLQFSLSQTLDSQMSAQSTWTSSLLPPAWKLDTSMSLRNSSSPSGHMIHPSLPPRPQLPTPSPSLLQKHPEHSTRTSWVMAQPSPTIVPTSLSGKSHSTTR